jgi:hypothetical protein
LNPVIAVLVGLILGVIAVSLIRIAKQPRRVRYFAACEYWVFIPDDKMPNQDEIMTSMVARNPHTQGGQAPVGAKEGILFSDVRLHCSLVLRAKNPHVFRPDIYAEVEVSPDILAGLSLAQAIVKIRYVSEVPLSDDRHLQFLPHMAGAYARMGKATAIYDAVTEQLFTPQEFEGILGQDIDVKRPEVHVRVSWIRDGGAARAETKGLIKKGMAELVTADARIDNERLVCEVLEDAAHLAWTRGENLETEIVEYFGDKFEVRILPPRERKSLVHIVRYQAI